jgi:hypothetical protein
MLRELQEIMKKIEYNYGITLLLKLYTAGVFGIYFRFFAMSVSWGFELSLNFFIHLLIVFGPLILYLVSLAKRFMSKKTSIILLIDAVLFDLTVFILLCIYWVLLFAISP